MELLVLGIAQDEAVVRIPQHEGFRDVLHRIHQAQLGILVDLVGLLLLRDVEDDAGQVREVLRLARGERHAGAEPDVIAIFVAHAELTVEGGDLAIEKLLDRVLELRVVRVNAADDFIEGQIVALHRHAEHLEHGTGPEDDAPAHVPVPHAALAAFKRLVEPRGGNAQNRIRFGRLGGLPVEGAAQQDQHEKRHNEEGGDLRDAGPPRRQHILLALEHNERSRKIAKVIHADEGIFAGGQPQRRHFAAVHGGARHEIGGEHAGDDLAVQLLGRRQAGGDLARARGHGENPLLAKGALRQDAGEIFAVQDGRRPAGAARFGEIRPDAGGHELTIECGQLVLFRHMGRAAVGELQQQRTSEDQQEQDDERGDQQAQVALRNADPEAPGPGRREFENPLLPKQLADMRLAQSIPLPARFCPAGSL